MTKTLPIVAAIIAAAVLIAWAPRQEPEVRIFPAPPVRIVAVSGTALDGPGRRYLWRLWSDGVIEENQRSTGGFVWRGWEVVPEDVFPP